MSKRVINVIRATGKDFSVIRAVAQRAGMFLDDEYQKVSEDEYEKILALVKSLPVVDKNVTVKKGSKDLLVTERVPLDFKQENPYAHIQSEFILKGFENRNPRFILVNNVTVETIFDDVEAYSICKGISIPRAAKIARDFFREANNDNLVEAHEFAMEAYKKYGNELLQFALQFPPLPFKAFDASNLFAELDRKSKSIGLPIVRVAFTNENGISEKLELRFYVERESEKTHVFKNVIEIRNKSTNTRVGRITRQGKLLPEDNAKNIIPIIQLFVRYSSDLRSLQINYGLETGECSICGKDLTDEISVKRGIGPTCYRNLAK